MIDEINEMNVWRDGEFAKFKINPNEVDSQLWARMCVPMIYAHWEGFVVSSLKMLLKHLNALNLRPTQIPTKLIVVGLGDYYRTLSGKQSFSQRCDFTDRFHNLLSDTIKFKTKVETKSNLKSEVLNELCQMFDFEFKKFKEVNPILDRLVQVRNCIAHGENSIIPSQQNIEDYIKAVQDGVDILIGEIDNYLTHQNYLYARSA
ncbi:MAE_28990/MAE_18760 family HEPN-like nuclease [Pantoea sp. USHLN256]|uniref:MAE_28990/MAE_18760 family HEPN-like nuclease n=1 Tax=Pantoea sp. USHLN256 TaxID=3081293 RepID=UPI0030173379